MQTIEEPPSCTIQHCFYRTEQQGQLGRPGTERTVRRIIRQPRPGHEIRIVRERTSSGNHRPDEQHRRTRHAPQSVVSPRQRPELTKSPFRAAPPRRLRSPRTREHSHVAAAASFTTRRDRRHHDRSGTPGQIASDRRRRTRKHRALPRAQATRICFGVLASACRAPCGRHSAGLIAGCGSYQAIEAALIQISRFLNSAANIAISIESHESGLVARVRVKLQQLGFRIEAGARCREGFVLAAHRHEFGQDFGVIRNAA